MSQPAARVGDMHTCPMSDGPKPHVGGPILPPGVPTVLIGGMPAATITNMCTCVSPAPDSVVKGSLGVLIGGKPAARMGDMTAHGGVITVGCPTVLIGDLAPVPPPTPLAMQVAVMTPCEVMDELQKPPQSEQDKKTQAALQKDLDKAFYDNLGNLPENKRQDAVNAFHDYQKVSDASDMARLSQAAYGENTYGECGNTPCGFKRIEGDELKEKFGISKKFMNHKIDDSGFRASVFESTTGKEPKYTVAYAGTETGQGMREFMKDMNSNMKQGAGLPDKQYNKALILADNMEDAVGPDGFQTTGHSLGGGLASVTSAVIGAKGTTFNAAGLHKKTTKRVFVSDKTRSENAVKVDAYYNSHDPLSRLQDNREKIFTGLGYIAGKAFGLLGSLGVGFLAASGALPKAYGNRIVIPSEKKGIGEHGIQDVIDLLDRQARQSMNDLKNNFGCP